MSEERPHAASHRESRFISGVYNYCDAWCERCRCQARCRLYHDRLRYEAEARGEPVPPNEDDAEDSAGGWTTEWQAILEEANREPTAAELEEAAREQVRIDTILAGDPLVIKAREYTEIVCGIRTGLDPLVQPTGDGLVGAAMDAISHHGAAIGVKVRRACKTQIRGDGHDEEFARQDGNGTAKLVRVMIRESREAWEVLMQPPHAIADGVPARMIARLDELDDGLSARFPEAMAFVRPGLDE